MQTYLVTDLSKFYRYCILITIIHRNFDSNYDPLFKVKPIIDHLGNLFETIEIMVAIEEMTVAFKHRHKWKCYMPQNQLSGVIIYGHWLVYQDMSTNSKFWSGIV